jgi:competence ComEA-like helix-hairpin-helix protein
MSRGWVFTVMLMLGLVPPLRAEKATLEGVVNINTASPEELRLLTGIGPARIRNILAYRHKHPFRTVEELARIKGIGRKMVRELRLHLAVNGPTTAQKIIRPVAAVAPAPPARPEPRPPTARPQPGQRILPRRGEPAHQAMAKSQGNSGLPPP